jgi:hypothetical protein
VSFDIDGERISLHGVNGGGASDWHFLTRFHDDRLCLSVCHASGHADVRIGDGRELLALSARAPAQKP